MKKKKQKNEYKPLFYQSLSQWEMGGESKKQKELTFTEGDEFVEGQLEY